MLKLLAKKFTIASCIALPILFVIDLALNGTKSNAAIGPTINSAYYTPGTAVANTILWINSQTGNVTNGVLSNIVNGITNICYPQSLSNTQSGATQYVCMIAIPIQGIHHLSLQFTVQPVTGNTNVGATNCVWEVVKSTSGGPVYNAAGTNGTNGQSFTVPGNTFYDVLGYVTNIFAAGSNFSTTIATYSDVPRTVATSTLSTDTGIAGVPMLYVYSVTIAPQTGITNYFVTGNGD